MGNPAQFAADLSKFADQIEGGIGVFRRRVMLDLKRKTELRTPVDTGFLRASWALSDSSPSAFVPKSAGIGPVDQSEPQPFDITFLVSNLPYAERIEFGHSTVKAPQGMVRISLAEIETELQATFG